MQSSSTRVPVPVAKRRVSAMRRQESWLAMLLILPSTLGTVVFAILPITASLGISLTNRGGLSRPRWVGLDNDSAALSDSRAVSPLSHSLLYVLLAIPSGVIINDDVRQLDNLPEVQTVLNQQLNLAWTGNARLPDAIAAASRSMAGLLKVNKVIGK